ncbi:MAG: AAA family ATPase [bacterium]
MKNKTTTIAVAGKGGVGKTTTACGIIRVLKDNGITPILAVDADPNSTLSDALGLEVKYTIAEILDESKDVNKQLPPGMNKQRYIEERFQMAIVESEGLDLFAMGHPDGPGCYCAPNSMLRAQLEALTPNYKAVVLDNEAGMEHISRRTSRRVDSLLVVSDPTIVGIRAAARIRDIVRELKLETGKLGLIVNRVHNGLPDKSMEEINKLGLDLLGTVPLDDEISKRALEGSPIFDISSDSEFLKAINEITSKVISE